MYDIGVFTNLSQDHLDFHDNMEEYRDAKARLFDQCRTAIINVDDEAGRWIMDKITTQTYTYGICKEADIYARELEITERGVTFSLHTPHGGTGINLGIPGIFSIYNALAAASVCYSLGIPLDVIAQGLEAVKGVDGRFELLDTGTDYSVILDYAHTPDGLENILRTAKGFAKGKVITLFGCGGDRIKPKGPLWGDCRKIFGLLHHNIRQSSQRGAHGHNYGYCARGKKNRLSLYYNRKPQGSHRIRSDPRQEG